MLPPPIFMLMFPLFAHGCSLHVLVRADNRTQWLTSTGKAGVLSAMLLKLTESLWVCTSEHLVSQVWRTERQPDVQEWPPAGWGECLLVCGGEDLDMVQESGEDLFATSHNSHCPCWFSQTL